MFRIARVRIRRIDSNQQVQAGLLERRTAQAAESPARRLPGRFTPWKWSVRVKWVGFGPVDRPLSKIPAATQTGRHVSNATSARLLRTFDMPNMKVHVRWLGFPSSKHIPIRTLVLLVVLVWFGLFALTRPAGQNNALPGISMETIDSANLVSYEANLAGNIIRMSHSQLDIGQSQDVFDNDTKTLIRGREANPFLLDFEFVEPQPVTGLVMDFGGMDFDLRVYVYDPEAGKPILYEGEYRNQPPEPHVEMDFLNGPALVSRIYIEIEQYNPPDEVHIHVREVLFKE